MCGIAGVYAHNGDQVVSSIFSMTNSMGHRGPDDEGYLLGNVIERTWVQATGPDTIPEIQDNPIGLFSDRQFNLALGMRRLAVLDLSSSGHGPLSYRGGKLWITYNGEIYNYVELRDELENLGHIFLTTTDTEVILAAYEEWGKACLDRFNGMWAFAIWDVNQQLLFCARDRFGIKPFVYYWDGHLFSFASEAKALLSHPKISASPDDMMVIDFLVSGISHHDQHTFFDKIKNLQASHYLEFDLRQNEFQIHRWWDIDLRELRTKPTISDEETIGTFLNLLTDSIRLRLRSDVSIGTCLSGGLDSSTIVSIANRLLVEEKVLPVELIGAQQKTFSACFDDPVIDERRFISQIIEKTNADAHFVFPKGKYGLWDEISDLHWHQEGPVGSTSVYSQWAVMRLAKENNVTVLLDGQGADELLAGYSYYFGSYLAEIARLDGLFKAIREASRGALTTRNSIQLLLGLMVISLFPPKADSISHNFINRNIRTYKTIHSKKIKPMFRNSAPERGRQSKKWGFTTLNSHLYDSLFVSSLPALLHYEDRNSTAFSIEARVPFLDYRLVQFVFQLATKFHINDGWTKWILRQSTTGIVPDTIRWRRGKIGFATPESHWMNSNRDIIRKLFSSTNLMSSRYLTQQAMEVMRKSKTKNFGQANGIWRMISLEVWMNRYFGS